MISYGIIDLGTEWLSWWLSAKHQVVISSKVDFSSTEPPHFYKILIKFQTFLLKKTVLGMSSGNCCPFGTGLKLLRLSDAIRHQKTWSTLIQVMACCLIAPREREREIKFIGLFENRGHRGPYSPYKPFNHNLYIGIIIFPHIDNPQYTGYDLPKKKPNKIINAKKVRAPLIWQIIGEKDSGSVYMWI